MVFAREGFSKPAFGLLLALYGALQLCWFVVAIVRGTDINEGLCTTVQRQTECVNGTGSGWGVVVVVMACVNLLVALFASFIGIFTLCWRRSYIDQTGLIFADHLILDTLTSGACVATQV